jgi:hypothetical protein
MSSPSNSNNNNNPNNNDSPGGGDGSGALIDEKPRLTEEEKKQNHIASGKLAAQPILAPQQVSAGDSVVLIRPYRAKAKAGNP